MKSPDRSGGGPVHIAGVIPLVSAWRVDRVFDYSCEGLDIEAGMVVQVPFGGRSVRGIVTSIRVGTTDRALQPIKKVVLSTPVARPPLGDFLDWLAIRYMVPRAQVYERVVPPRVRVSARPTAREVVGPIIGALNGLTGSEQLLASISSRNGGVWCLRPPWGADRSALIAGLVSSVPEGAALVTVPEVAHGSSVLDHLIARWPDAVRVDSAQEPKDRATALVSLANGARLGIGGRSAVFAPSSDVSLIVMDEEHERSYKEDRTPRFDARVAMVERARMQRAVCVLVSAHPRVETGHAVLSGKFGEVHAGRNNERNARPHVEFVDKPRDGAVSHLMHRRIKETLERNERIGLLVPASGYARALWCSECRRSLRCPRCESGMRFDRAGGKVDCPRCGFESAPPDRCPNCGASAFRYLGAGSERLQEQIAMAFPRSKVVRVDPATVDDELDVGAANIYVTTWVGTKPALRPTVGMVGLIDADALLRRPDFRAAEHAFQAFSEMAEWAGPAATGGRLVVQTDDPGHYSLQAVARADYGFFLRHELESRKELRYPPFSELITIYGPDVQDPGLATAAQICLSVGAGVLGPAPRLGERGASLVAKCKDAQEVAAALRDLASSAAGRGLSFDVDPR